jgi:hypothetical protein
MSAKRDDNKLNAKGWTGDKPYLMTVNTGASMTITRSDITAGLPKRKQMAMHSADGVSGDLPVLKEVLVELTQGIILYGPGCSSPRSRMSSSWDWMSFMPMMHPWARKKCSYGISGHDQDCPPPYDGQR